MTPPAVPASAGTDGEASSALQALLAGVFEVAGPDRSAPPGRVEFVARASGQFLLSDIRAPSFRLTRPAATGARVPDECFGLRFQLSGAAKGMAGDKSVALGAGDLLFFDLQQSLDLSIAAGPNGARDICLWVARPRILAAFGRDDVLHGLVLSGASTAGATIGTGLRSLAETAGNLSVQEMDALCDGLIALAAKALGPLLAAPRATVLSPAAAFITIRRYIDRNLRSPALDADRLADIYGVSRASLYRLFEPVGGVASYIRKARLNRAYQEIVTGELPSRRVSAIAFSLGFTNVSAFNRAFKDHYGVSPRAARHRAAAAGPMPPPAPAESAAPPQNLAYWLARIATPPGLAAERKR
ncbi:helix-turn-helix domain-containing protein [Rhodoblastus sp.]|uniref:helix-turn-helix domain-containing protein n=1 Tax=Rhodoblastus sp. TaxID=1962975 RepID=UPI003F9DB3D0